MVNHIIHAAQIPNYLGLWHPECTYSSYYYGNIDNSYMNNLYPGTRRHKLLKEYEVYKLVKKDQ